MDYLETVSTDDLHEILAEVEEKKPVQRVLAGIAYKDGLTQTRIAEHHDVHPNTVRNWLTRLEQLEEEPFEAVVYDDPRPGQSRDLDAEEYERFVDVLTRPPDAAGLDASAWTVPLAQQYLKDTFDVEYCQRHVRRLLTEAGLSSTTAQLVDFDSDDHTQDGFQTNETRTIWTVDTEL